MIVIDTHIWLWVVGDRQKISPNATEVIDQANHIGISAISMWEIAMLSRKGKVTLDRPVRQWLDKYLEMKRFCILPFTPEIAASSEALDMHGDPADRIITATAIAQNCPLVTADGLIQKSGLVQTIW